MKFKWRKTDWESFKFWKSNDECYRRKRWLLGIFGFGLGWYIGQGTMYDMFYAVVGMAVCSFIGAIIDAIGVANWNRTHEDVYLQQVLEEDRKAQEKEEARAAKRNKTADLPQQEDAVVPSQDIVLEEDDEDEEELIIIDESFLNEIDDGGEE